MRLTMAQEYNRRRVQAMYGWQVAVPVPYDGIGMDGEAAARLREAAAQVATDAGVPVALVARRLFDYAYRLEPTGTLVLLVGVPERGVELFVEMGAQHWRPVRPEDQAPEGTASEDDADASTPDGPPESPAIRDSVSDAPAGAHGLPVMDISDLMGGPRRR
ncbi:MAG: hypothetical protein LBU75_13730 [Desulfovibrio sp.]|jgi:hypothetical protein|nr:hypothetical protein [Desulfovibrio sp.]